MSVSLRVFHCEHSLKISQVRKLANRNIFEGSMRHITLTSRSRRHLIHPSNCRIIITTDLPKVTFMSRTTHLPEKGNNRNANFNKIRRGNNTTLKRGPP